ncbi:MAG: PTS sugar transporter subunit IIA [Vitreimonas sp.]
MKIEMFLSPEHAIAGLRAPDKMRLLHDLAARAASTLALPPERVEQALVKREELGSTGVGGGVAIPHARLPELAHPLGVLAHLRKPIDFDAIDQKPVDVVFLLLTPAAEQGEHLNALATVARKLREPERLRDIRSAEGDAALYLAMTRAI